MFFAVKNCCDLWPILWFARYVTWMRSSWFRPLALGNTSKNSLRYDADCMLNSHYCSANWKIPMLHERWWMETQLLRQHVLKRIFVKEYVSKIMISSTGRKVISRHASWMVNQLPTTHRTLVILLHTPQPSVISAGLVLNLSSSVFWVFCTSSKSNAPAEWMNRSSRSLKWSYFTFVLDQEFPCLALRQPWVDWKSCICSITKFLLTISQLGHMRVLDLIAQPKTCNCMRTRRQRNTEQHPSCQKHLGGLQSFGWVTHHWWVISVLT